MKQIYLLLFSIVLLACGGQKKAIKNAQKETSKVVTKTEPVNIPETPTPPKTPKVIETPKTDVPVAETKIDPPVTPTKTPDVITTTPVEEPVVTSPTKPKTTFNHSPFNELLEQYVSTQGNVNYRGFKNDKTALRNYITSLSENRPNNNWSKAEKMAYWINAYNAMTIDLILRNYPVKSIKDIKDPWKQRLWKLGEKWYNLDEIEHKILRKMGDPRIHFAIVCASYSCPKLAFEAYTASSLDSQLNIATKEFLRDPERNKLSENNIKLSKIFKWFAEDFKTNGSLIDFLNLHSDVTIANNAKKTFMEYSWDLNQ